MPKICPDCGFQNDDELSFCHACGEPLDADLRLIQQIQQSPQGASQLDQNRVTAYRQLMNQKVSTKPKKDFTGALLVFLIVLCLLSAAGLASLGLMMQFGLLPQ